jgi:membrane protein implicated in regulation of membrane protease activity
MGTKSTSDIFFIFSIAAAMMAVLSWSLKPDALWLAATQWLVVAIAVGVWAVYLRLRDIHEGKTTVTLKNGNGKAGKKK